MAELKKVEIIALERSTPKSLYERHLQTPDQLIDCFPATFEPALLRMARILAELKDEPADRLKLISKRDSYMINSWYSNIDKLKQKSRDRNYLFMHPGDAEKRQIVDGAQVTISNANGSIECPVKLSDELIEGVVAMTHGWGHKASNGMRLAQKKAGVNCNVLLPSGSNSFEPLSNQAHMTGIPVDVAPL